MSRRTFIFLIILILVLTGFFLINNFYFGEKTIKDFVSSNPASTNAKDARLLFKPNPINIGASNSATLDVVVDSGEIKDANSLVQLEIAFDPAIISSINALPGTDLQNHNLALINIDYDTGRLSYAIRGNLAKNGSNIVAVIPFNINSYSMLEQTEIRLMPKTAVTINGKIQNLEALDTVVISLPAPAPFYYNTSTPSAIVTP